MITEVYGIKLECGNCRACTRCSWTKLWHNQHGVKIRIFCGHCGAKTEVRNLYALPFIDTPVVRKMPHDRVMLPWWPKKKVIDRSSYLVFANHPVRARAPYTTKSALPAVCKHFHNSLSYATSDSWGLLICHEKFADIPF